MYVRSRKWAAMRVRWNMVDTFVEWCGRNHVQLSVAKMKEEMMVDIKRTKIPIEI